MANEKALEALCIPFQGVDSGERAMVSMQWIEWAGVLLFCVGCGAEEDLGTSVDGESLVAFAEMLI